MTIKAYLLSLPERLIRSTVGLGAGVAREVSEVALPDDLAQPGSADPIECGERRRQIADAFGQLPLKLRVAATLSLIEEQSPKEIAEALGTSEGAVRVRVFRAVRLLRQHLKRVGVKP